MEPILHRAHPALAQLFKGGGEPFQSFFTLGPSPPSPLPITDENQSSPCRPRKSCDHELPNVCVYA